MLVGSFCGTSIHLSGFLFHQQEAILPVEDMSSSIATRVANSLYHKAITRGEKTVRERNAPMSVQTNVGLGCRCLLGGREGGRLLKRVERRKHPCSHYWSQHSVAPEPPFSYYSKKRYIVAFLLFLPFPSSSDITPTPPSITCSHLFSGSSWQGTRLHPNPLTLDEKYSSSGATPHASRAQDIFLHQRARLELEFSFEQSRHFFPHPLPNLPLGCRHCLARAVEGKVPTRYRPPPPKPLFARGVFAASRQCGPFRHYYIVAINTVEIWKMCIFLSLDRAEFFHGVAVHLPSAQTYERVLKVTTYDGAKPMAVKRGEYGAAQVCKGEGNGRPPRENTLTSGIVGHDSHMRRSGGDPTRNRTRLALVRGEQSSHCTTVDFLKSVPVVNCLYSTHLHTFGICGGVVGRVLAFHMGEPGSIPVGVAPGRCHWMAGFLGDLPPPLNSDAAPHSHRFALIGVTRHRCEEPPRSHHFTHF
ncbi:hypothetical protein PR048_022523 [Dryococelus australis]|uniref:Uncharacterized protein n=1 Tax=Dryococelus australis TaxID=614101 RepID=A0ABQ9H1A7_9NEOP|nr:hypothetical protein PR048_022523 [Dryococelus australis]